MKKVIIGALAAAVISTGFAMAASHVGAIDARKAAMKEVGGAMGAMAKMAKGEADFDAAVVLASLQKINEVSKTFADHFPAGSETGMASDGKETTVAPKIWEDMDGFKAAIMKLDTDTAAAIAAAPQSLEELGPVLGSVGGNCKACHETYRVKTQ
jgi:cytochrome c556